MLSYATGSPISGFLLQVVVPHALFFGYLVAFGEIAIGLGALFGFLFRPAAFFGMFLNLIFFLSVSWHVYPYFYGADIVFVFSWLTLLQQLRQQQRRQIAAQIEREKRRSFLRGSLTGGAGILGLGALIYIFRALVIGYENTGTDQTPLSGSGAPQGASTPTSSGGDNGATSTASSTSAGTTGAIAQVKAVPANSATTFTIPSSGDPGILIHLNNGQFVAYDALCTHAGCQVSYDPSQQLLACPCHGAAFDPAKAAAVVQGPAPTPLAPVSIHVDSATGAIALK